MKREYPLRPIAAVAAVVFRDGLVLLSKRANPPGKGNWALPGGVVEVGESVREAVIREVREECGLDVVPEKLLTVFDSITRDEEDKIRYHYILFEFLCTVVGGNLTWATDSQETRWVFLQELEELPMNPATVKFIRKVASELAEDSLEKR